MLSSGINDRYIRSWQYFKWHVHSFPANAKDSCTRSSTFFAKTDTLYEYSKFQNIFKETSTDIGQISEKLKGRLFSPRFWENMVLLTSDESNENVATEWVPHSCPWDDRRSYIKKSSLLLHRTLMTFMMGDLINFSAGNWIASIIATTVKRFFEIG